MGRYRFFSLLTFTLSHPILKTITKEFLLVFNVMRKIESERQSRTFCTYGRKKRKKGNASCDIKKISLYA